MNKTAFDIVNESFEKLAAKGRDAARVHQRNTYIKPAMKAQKQVANSRAATAQAGKEVADVAARNATKQGPSAMAAVDMKNKATALKNDAQKALKSEAVRNGLKKGAIGAGVAATAVGAGLAANHLYQQGKKQKQEKTALEIVNETFEKMSK